MFRASPLIVGLTLVLAACGSGGEITTTVPTIPPISTTSAATTAVPVEDTLPAAASTTTTSTPQTTTTLEGVTVLEVVVLDGVVAELEVTLDDFVRLTISADVSDEAHLHGYDLHADVAPGVPGVLEFTASIPGVFEIEFEGAGTLVAELRVEP